MLLFKDDASGSSDSWAMMVAKINYTFTIELGPIQEQLHDSDYEYGFHVAESKIKYVAKRAYSGIHAYLKTFVEKSGKRTRRYIEKKCMKSYLNMIANFTGYWKL